MYVDDYAVICYVHVQIIIIRTRFPEYILLCRNLFWSNCYFVCYFNLLNIFHSMHDMCFGMYLPTFGRYCQGLMRIYNHYNTQYTSKSSYTTLGGTLSQYPLCDSLSACFSAANVYTRSSTECYMRI